MNLHFLFVTEVKCLFCAVAFKKNENESLIMNHCKTCTKPKRPSKQYNYVCFVCKHHTRKYSDMIGHIRKHTGLKPFNCNSCNYICSTKTALSVHNKRHTGERPHQCTKCDYNSITKSHLVRHMKIKH